MGVKCTCGADKDVCVDCMNNRINELEVHLDNANRHGYRRQYNKCKELKPCPFCGGAPRRWVSNDILHVECPNCVSVGFHSHVRFGALADAEWNTRAC